MIMIPFHIQKLSEFSRIIRESTLTKLNMVAKGDENWRPVFGAMTFSDLAWHLSQCDKWLFEKLKNPNLKSIAGKPGEGRVESRREYKRLLGELKKTGKLRSLLLNNLTDRDLMNSIFDDRYAGQVDVWWLIVRGNLDHEIHHRGQIAIYLKILANRNKETD
jgi:uncharacterized damage-inducible protein DinB